MKRGILFFICLVVLASISCKQQAKLFPVTQNGKYGYIDKTGTIVINPQFDRAEHFSEGLALVKVGDKYGYIDKTGKIVINPQFDAALNFSEGLAEVNIGSKWGYIDKTGKYVWEPTR